MEFDNIQYDKTGLVSLFDFKRIGKLVLKDMDQPVMVSINIRNLKFFNEVYGFDSGDDLIQRMVRHFCTENEHCRLAAKTYADHLLVITEGYGVSERFLKARMQESIRVFMTTINSAYPMAKIHISCGAYIMMPQDDLDVAQDNARYARMSITHKYSNQIAFYSKELRVRYLQEASVIPNFENALEKNKIHLFLQPKFSIEGQKLVGAEALSRIEDDFGNVMSPNLYVPVLESAELITELDFQMVALVLEAMKKWKRENGELITISVNLSRADFLVEGFLEKVDALVEQSGIPKEKLEFELTETLFCENLESVINKVNWLRDCGYRISMDDFGSGYNSLYILGKIPTDVIKFDRAFVLNSLQNEEGREVMRSLVNMFQRINFDVICEGVETKEEEKLVYECGCNMIQGYLHDKPIPASEFEKKYIQRMCQKRVYA